MIFEFIIFEKTYLAITNGILGVEEAEDIDRHAITQYHCAA